MVDEGRIAFRPAVEISYLLKDEQEELYEAMSFADATPILAQAIKMKEFSNNGKLTPEVIESIMGEEKPNQREKFSFLADRLRKFIPASVPYSKTEEYVLKALEHYHRYQERIANCNSSIAREASKPVGIVTYHFLNCLPIRGSRNSTLQKWQRKDGCSKAFPISTGLTGKLNHGTLISVSLTTPEPPILIPVPLKISRHSMISAPIPDGSLHVHGIRCRCFIMRGVPDSSGYRSHYGSRYAPSRLQEEISSQLLSSSGAWCFEGRLFPCRNLFCTSDFTV